MDQFVECKTSQEALLLTLIDRNDRIEALLQKLVHPPKPRDNALDTLTPAGIAEPIKEEQDADFCANNMKFGYRTSPEDQTMNQVDTLVRYSSNLERLTKNGFQWERLCPEYYRVKWPKRGPSRV